MEYELATEKSEYRYIEVIMKTNCIDKKDGHSYYWVSPKHPEYNDIANAFPKLSKQAGTFVKCKKCAKITTST